MRAQVIKQFRGKLFLRMKWLLDLMGDDETAFFGPTNVLIDQFLLIRCVLELPVVRLSGDYKVEM